MARVAKKKKKVTPRHRRGNNATGAISFENWKELDGYEFHRLRRRASSFYYENYKLSDLIPFVWQWMKENDYSSDDIKAAKEVPPGVATLPTLCKLMLDGCPSFNKKHNDYWKELPGTSGEVIPLKDSISSKIAEMIAQGSRILSKKQKQESEKKELYKPTIQDRIATQTNESLQELDKWIEGFLELRNDKKFVASFDINEFDIRKHFTKHGVTQAHARLIKQLYEPEIEDLKLLDNFPTGKQLRLMPDDEEDSFRQLQEGHRHNTKPFLRKYVKCLERIIDECNFVIDQGKVQRKSRKPKVKSAEKLVEKMKYCKSNDKYKINSINPAQVIGASELWVFNVKTRKIGKYIAANPDPTGQNRSGSGLQVKGTTLQGFNEDLSIQKTLRKPEEQLKEFGSLGKVALRKYLQGIATTDTKLNGRINQDTVLLKVS